MPHLFQEARGYTRSIPGAQTPRVEKKSLACRLQDVGKIASKKKQQKEHLQKIMVVGYRLAFIYFHLFYCLRGMTKRKDRATRVCCRICTKISETVAK